MFFVLQLSLVGLWSRQNVPKTTATYAAAILTLVSVPLLSSLSMLEHERNVRPSTVLIVYLSVTIIFDIAHVRTWWYVVGGHKVASLYSAAFGVKGIILLLELVEKRSLLKPRLEDVSHEATASVINRSLFLWINPLFVLGSRSILTVKELFSIPGDILQCAGSRSFSDAWRSSTKKEEYSLLRAFVWHYKWDILAGVPPKLAFVGFSFAQPFVVQRVLDFIDEPESENSANIAYGLIGAYVLVYIGAAVSYAYYEHKTDRLVLKVRGTMVDLIFEKTLCMRTTAASDASALTLMSADVDRVGNGLREFHETWSAILEVGLAFWLLERLIGVAVIAPALFTTSECTEVLLASNS